MTDRARSTARSPGGAGRPARRRGRRARLRRAGRAEDKDPPPPTSVESVEITARPIAHFERGRPDAKRFGQLEFRGGLVLELAVGALRRLVGPRHGGGRQEPAGDLRRRQLDDGATSSTTAARPTGLDARAPRAAARQPTASRSRASASRTPKALALLDGTLQNGTLLIGFERLHRIGRFPVRDGEVLAPDRLSEAAGRRASACATTRASRPSPCCKGGPLQGLGRRLRRAPDARQRLSHRLDLGCGSGEAQKFQLQDIDGFNITDAASLADGSLLVLERYFRWSEGVKMRLRHHPGAARSRPARASPAARCSRATSSFEIDNMEGLAVHQRRRRRDHPLADLRRQLQPPAAAHAVPAVHAPRGGAEERRAPVMCDAATAATSVSATRRLNGALGDSQVDPEFASRN